MTKETLKNILIVTIAVGGIASTYAITSNDKKGSENEQYFNPADAHKSKPKACCSFEPKDSLSKR